MRQKTKVKYRERNTFQKSRKIVVRFICSKCFNLNVLHLTHVKIILKANLLSSTLSDKLCNSYLTASINKNDTTNILSNFFFKLKLLLFVLSQLWGRCASAILTLCLNYYVQYKHHSLFVKLMSTCNWFHKTVQISTRNVPIKGMSH